MININENDLGMLPIIGRGFFGAVYRVDENTAYKIYHPTIKYVDGLKQPNPAITHIKKRISRFKRRDKKLKLTSLPNDLILINGKVGGIKIPYYDGETLANLRNLTYSVKKNITYQLVEAHKELIENLIYPEDYHLDNVMYIDGKIKLIDLDDPLTHVPLLPNPFFKFLAGISLNENICKLFDAFNRPFISEVKEKLAKETLPDVTKEDFIEKFLKEKEEITAYIIVDSTSNIDLVKKLAKNNNYRILFLIDKQNFINYELLKIIDSYSINNLNIYDFVNYSEIQDYLNNCKVSEKHEVTENSVYHK